MAESIMNALGNGKILAESAGIEPGSLNPIVVDAMREMGIDISSLKVKSVRDLVKLNKTYDFVVTVCDESSAQRCPNFAGASKRMHMGFPDPSKFRGTHEVKLRKTIVVRDDIKRFLQQWLKRGLE